MDDHYDDQYDDQFDLNGHPGASQPAPQSASKSASQPAPKQASLGQDPIVLSGCHFLTIDCQEKANRLATMMHAISLQESKIAFTRNQLETLKKHLEENKTKVAKMRSEMDYYSALTHIETSTKAAGIGYMAQQISIQDSQNTIYSNQIDEGRKILAEFLQQLDKMELEMSEYRRLPVC